jgi:hypothetical protein
LGCRQGPGSRRICQVLPRSGQLHRRSLRQELDRMGTKSGQTTGRILYRFVTDDGAARIHDVQWIQWRRTHPRA